jgi:Sec-independent protein translocase protein TatA
MLDNLGFGEFFFLGLLLFLFFGPERLPQMGARLGRWVSNLTRYSGAFMNEWREEALAVHDAMEQVRGMRDEIAAARAEIASTLHEARDDLGEAVQGARQDVGQQVQRATRFVPEERAAGGAIAPEGEARAAFPQAVPPKTSLPAVAARSEDAAVGKTQQVVDQLLAKRASASTTPHAPRDEPRAAPERPLSERRLPLQAPPSPADLARLRDQVRDLEAEMEELRAAVAEMCVALEGQAEARVPAVIG